MSLHRVTKIEDCGWLLTGNQNQFIPHANLARVIYCQHRFILSLISFCTQAKVVIFINFNDQKSVSIGDV